MEEVYHCAVQDRAKARDQLRADQRARLAQEDSARLAEEARSRLEAEAKRAFDQANRDEVKRQAGREKAGILAARAAAKREREREEQNAKEKQHQDRDRAERARREEKRTQREAEERHLNEARQRREDNAQQPWSIAWEVYMLALPRLDPREVLPTDLEICIVDFWPTRVGSYASCNEVAVRKFFDHRSSDLERRAMRKHAVVWHPDRAMRLFVNAKDKEAILRTVTMVTQVVNSVMDGY